MGTAKVNGPLWGARVRDYARLVEVLFSPAYDRVLSELNVKPGVKLLDVGCGPGLAAHLAAERGAHVAGLDAAEASLEVARERTPNGDFRVGDIEELPWPDNSFDVVTGFNSFQFASDVVGALREAKRVAKPGGLVSMMVWGLDEDCESMVTIGAVGKLMPPPESPPAPGPPLGAPGAVEGLMEQAGLKPLKSGEVKLTWDFEDLPTAVQALTSAGVMVAAGRQLGEDTVRRTVEDSLKRFQRNGHVAQDNNYRYVIAEA